MSLIPIDEVVHVDAITSHPSTGAATDADSTPTFSVFEEDTDTPIVGPSNLTKRTSLDGNYRGSFTASAANGFEAGKWYSVVVSATVNSVAGKGAVMHFRIAPAETSAGVPQVRVSALADDVITAAAHDESTAFPVKSADTGSTQIARVGADGDTLETLSDQLDALPVRLRKNTAFSSFHFLLVSSTDHVTGVTGATVTATRAIDNGSFAACANAVAEVGNGLYRINLDASDVNGNIVTFRFTASGADARVITAILQEAA